MERLSKNFMWMAAANVAGSLFGILVFIYMARALLPDAFGQISYALSLVYYVANFIDLGLSTYAIREISKERSRVSVYASEIISLRLFAAIALCLILIGVTLISPCSGTMKMLLIGSSLMLFVVAFSSEWAFQGLEKMHMVFISFATTGILQLILIFIFVKGPQDLLKTPIIYFASSIPVLITFLTRLKFKFITRLDLKSLKLYLSSSLVIWAISLFAQVYNGLDIAILGFFKDPAEVGYFSIARRIISAVTFFFIFLANALLPRLSCTFCSDVAEFSKSVRKFLKLAALLTILIFLPLIVFSGVLISHTVGSQYLPARLPLNIMFIGLIFVLFNLPFSTGLVAAGFEKDVLKQVIACAVFSILTNLIFMPRYGMIGASASFLATEVLALVWILYAYRSRMKICLGRFQN